MDENGYVIDFIALRDTLMEIIATLDHRMLLPTKHSMIKVVTEGEEVVVRFEKKRWVFPVGDCVLLEIANTTAELLASHIAGTLIERLREKVSTDIDRIEVAVDENRGQWAVVTLPW